MVPFDDFMSCGEVNRASLQALVRIALVCLLAAAAAMLPPLPVHAEPKAIRAVSLSAADLATSDAPLRLTAVRDSGVDTVFIPVSLHDEIPAQTIDAIIRDAHARGLRVHAAIPLMLAAPAGALPLSRQHVIYEHPEWLMVPREMAIELQPLDIHSPGYLGRLARWTRANTSRVDGLYLSPLQPDAAAFVTEAVRRVVSRHDWDGVHFEAAGFPGRTFDYSVRALEVFREEMRRTLPPAERARIDEVELIDPFAYAEELPDAWQRFRTARLTALVAQLRTVVRDARPGAIVSAAATGGPNRALADHLQDWRTWADSGFVDALSGPPAKTTLLFSYETLIDSVGPSAGGDSDSSP